MILIILDGKRMASNSSANIGFEKLIWDAACVLWEHIPAADYRKVIVELSYHPMLKFSGFSDILEC